MSFSTANNFIFTIISIALVSTPTGGLDPRRRVPQPADTHSGLAAAAGVLKEGFVRFWRRWNPETVEGGAAQR